MSCKRVISDVVAEDSEAARILYENFTSEVRPGYVLVDVNSATGEKYCMPRCYRDYENLIDGYEVRDSDVYVTSFPKTGTTWLQEMVWCIMNDVDLEKAKSQIIQERFPFIDASVLFDIKPGAKIEDNPSLPNVEFLTKSFEFAAKQSGPNRFMKTHLPWPLLPTAIRTGSAKPKIIYVYRNPLDTCISHYHHSRALEGYTGDLEQFVQLFTSDLLTYAPYFAQIQSFIREKHRENLLILTFEELKKDLRAIINRVSKFLDKTLSSDQIDALQKHLSFASMSQNKMVNYELFMDPKEKFLRSGKVGGYKVEMSGAQIARVENWMNEQMKNFSVDFGVNLVDDLT